MKRKIIAIGSVLLLLIIVLFWGRKKSNNDRVDDMRKIIALNKVLQNGIVNLYENEVETEAEEDDMDRYYGHYKISQFCPTKYYGHLK